MTIIEQPQIANFPTDGFDPIDAPKPTESNATKPTNKKGNKTMTKKNATKTNTTKNANAKKENATMPKTNAAANESAATPKPKSAYTERKEYAAALRAQYADEIADTEPLAGVTSCLPGKTIANLTDDPNEQDFLARAAAYFDAGTAFCTESQAKKFGGTLADPEHVAGILVNWKPKTTKAGVTSTWQAVVYPVDAFEWENGTPTFDEQLDAERKARRAKRAAKRAADALKEANEKAGIPNKPKRRTAKATTKPAAAAPSADVAAMTETMNALMQQNAQLIAALTAALAK